MEFRPCIDIHNGMVKQIIGGSLTDQHDLAIENFTTHQDAAYYAKLYQSKNIKGGHVIILNGTDSVYYEASKQQALHALHAYPDGLQIGGGITAENAREYLDAGASHVIVTSYVFRDGIIQEERLHRLVEAVGSDRLVLDLSCRKKNGHYYIVTNRWQKYTEVELNYETLEHFASFCSEFLIHAVDVEGKASGIETELVTLLGGWGKLPITYAGGVHSQADLNLLRELGKGHINVTIGSALDLFGGSMSFSDMCNL
ncbi:MAG: phosphoribosylformimino-5-aminoimidazole carboxamide ribotide isomerase [Lachnospiraceae bacterium]